MSNPETFEEKNLLIFDNNLSFEYSDFVNKRFKKIILVENKDRFIKLSKKVLTFKSQLIEDQKQRLMEKSIDCEVININKVKDISEEIFCLYPTVGENLDWINKNNKKNIKFLYRKLDQNSWQYCNKGFFNFKNYIPKIISTFN